MINVSFFICCKVSNYFCNYQIKRTFILNKKHFYYFLCFSSKQFNIEQFKMRRWRTIQNSTFNIQNSSCHPDRSSNLVPRLAVVGVVLLLSLTDRSSLENKIL